MKSFFFTRFKTGISGNGGIRRFTQVDNALSQTLNYTIKTTLENIKKWDIDKKWHGLKYQWLLTKYPVLTYWKGSQQDYAKENFHYATEWVERYNQEIESMDFILVDDPVYFPPLVDMISTNSKLPLIAFVHNIESLSTEHIYDEKQSALYQYELSLLKKFDLCITISREETFLLKNLGLNVFYFPYYPPDRIEKRMLEVRKKREQSNKKDILFVGSVYNTPTGNGLITLIEAWKEQELFKTGNTLLIAGYGTKEFLSYAENVEGVKFLGPLDDKTLDELLGNVVCSIIYQATGAGALTKITEFLIAGVPMLANSHAMRSYYNVPGIYEFTSFSDISKIILNADLESTQMTPPKKPDSIQLLDAIMKINSLRTTVNLEK